MTAADHLLGLTAGDDQDPFAYAVRLSTQESRLFSDPDLVSFELRGSRQLVQKLLTADGQVLRLTFSGKAAAALDAGVAQLVTSKDGSVLPLARAAVTGRAIDTVGLIKRAVPFATTPAGMAALVSVAAITELAGVLEQAFSVVVAQLDQLHAKLDDAFWTDVKSDVAVIRTAMSQAGLAEECLRNGGTVPTTVGLATAVSDAEKVFGKYALRVTGFRGALAPLLAEDAERLQAYAYLAQLDAALPHKEAGLAASIAVLAAAGTAVMYTKTVQQTSLQIALGHTPGTTQHYEASAQTVRDELSAAQRLLADLCKVRFDNDKTRLGRPIGGGYLTKLPQALDRHWELLALRDELVPRLQAVLRPHQEPAWVELEVKREGDQIVGRARSHRITSSPIGQRPE